MTEITDGIFPELLAMEIEIKDKGMSKRLKALALLLIGVAIGRVTSNKKMKLDIDELAQSIASRQKNNHHLKLY